MIRKWKDILIFVLASVVLLLANMALSGSFTAGTSLRSAGIHSARPQWT